MALVAVWIASAGAPSPVLGQAPTPARVVREQGFGPVLNEGSSTMSFDDPSAGAVNVIVARPHSPDILYAGTVSGGVWVTFNATSPFPFWIPLTDRFLPQLPISSLAMSPLRPNVLFAGTGSTSSADQFNSIGLGIGVARSMDGGLSWAVLARETFSGRVINSIVPTILDGGQTILAATWLDPAGVNKGGGVYRSTDHGETFHRISGNGASSLPDAGVTSLIGDPLHPRVFYAAVPQAANPLDAQSGAVADGGVYRSDDGGVTWARASAGITSLSDARRILLAIHSSPAANVLYADVINWAGGLGGVFRSTDRGATWTQMPSPPQLYQSKKGGQQGTGQLHAAIAADPRNPAVVFIGGNDQTLDSKPNANGCSKFNATVYRYDGLEWENVVCDGANGTGPHADSRSMTFDVGGSLLFASDGGPARLASPNDASQRRWVSLAGNLRSAELKSVAYDPVSRVLVGGAQDNGASYQLTPGGFTWCQLVSGDGGKVAVDADQGKHPGRSFRYMSAENFGEFTRTEWDASNRLLSSAAIGLEIVSGPGTGQPLLTFDAENIAFVQPFALNAVDPSRMLIGTKYLYESWTGGDTLVNAGCFTTPFSPQGEGCEGAAVTGSKSSYGQPIAYGGRLDGDPRPDVFYVGAGNQIFHRVTSAGPITTLDSYPGSEVITVAMNPRDYRELFVSDSKSKVWASVDEGASWTDVTGNLPSLTFVVTAIAIGEPDLAAGRPRLFAGGLGVFRCYAREGPTGPGCLWAPVVPGVNPALVLDLHHAGSAKALIAATLGRGAWVYRDWMPGGAGGGRAAGRASGDEVGWSEAGALSGGGEARGLPFAENRVQCSKPEGAEDREGR